MSEIILLTCNVILLACCGALLVAHRRLRGISAETEIRLNKANKTLDAEAKCLNDTWAWSDLLREVIMEDSRSRWFIVTYPGGFCVDFEPRLVQTTATESFAVLRARRHIQENPSCRIDIWQVTDEGIECRYGGSMHGDDVHIHKL